MTCQQSRLMMVVLLLAGAALTAFLVIAALGQNVSYFRTPSEVAAQTYPEAHSGRGFRLGGMVEGGSVVRSGTRLDFRVTDYAESVPIHYEGTIPDLFREGQGVVVEGKMGANGIFNASLVLAKHDEKYMPPAVAKSMKMPPAASGTAP